jgi:hypothetical protein
MGAARARAGPTRIAPGLLALAAFAACGYPGQGEKLVPVAGRVTVDGRPLTFGAVSFRPDPSRGNASRHHPTGTIDADGRFELYTTGEKGAPPGWYKVLVFADDNQAGGPVHPAPPRWAVAAKYTGEQTTDLFVEVVEKPAPGAHDLRLSK